MGAQFSASKRTECLCEVQPRVVARRSVLIIKSIKTSKFLGHVDYVSQVRVLGLEGTLAASRAGLSCLLLLSPVSLLSVHKNLPFLLAQQPRRLLQNLLPVDHRVIPDLLLPNRR